MIARRLAIVLAALLVAALVVRNAAVRAFADRAPATAAKVWASNPEVRIPLELTKIAEAAREGRAVPPDTLRAMYEVSRTAPLAPEPFLVRGVEAQLSGNLRAAEQAFLAARWRDGRSLPARYFLAEQYFRRGNVVNGLREVGALARLAPNGVQSLSPYVAAYARNTANWPELRRLFASEPDLADSSLVVLSADAANASTVMALADPKRSGPKSPWLTPLVASLTKAGQYARARDIWARVAQVRLAPGALIYDPEFRDAGTPPPFNWTLASSSVGLAERLEAGGLHAMFYGQQDGVLAGQMLVLPPGRYRLSAQLASAAGASEALKWNLVCDKTGASIASIPLRQAVSAGGVFEVAPSCPGQRLELFGASSDVPQQSELTIRSVSITPVGPNA